MTYLPGTHLVATIQPSDPACIKGNHSFKKKLDELILQYDLKKLGEVYHEFEPGGFTAVVCLSESHISIHTWPEHNLANLDIYLSNYQRSNDNTVQAIFDALVTEFKASVVHQQSIRR